LLRNSNVKSESKTFNVFILLHQVAAFGHGDGVMWLQKLTFILKQKEKLCYI
jgi:hypothetical protein